jgi:cleavage and polyadenylation specificity factor subunit 2
MSASIKFTPLYGAHGGGAMSFLLQLGDFTILLDCGWLAPFDLQVLQPLREVVHRIDAGGRRHSSCAPHPPNRGHAPRRLSAAARPPPRPTLRAPSFALTPPCPAPLAAAVLISHPDLAHMGALPFLVGRLGLAAPVYATGAVHKMGQMCLYDAFLALRAASDFDAFDLDDVDAAFARLTQLRYRQEVALTGRGAGVSLTPLAAGRLLGGAVWRVAAGGEEALYAVDFNHRRERHLAGAALEAASLRPALLVADAGSAGRAPADRERCERALVDSCLAALRGDGSVLIPVDAGGRVLEIALVLERHWAEHKLTYPVALVGPMAHTALEFARSQLEWMSEALVRSFGHSKDNPFNLRHVRPAASLAELRRLPPGPRVVLATGTSLDGGAARALFAELAPDPRNAVLFLVEPEAGSLGAQVLGAAAERDARPGAPPPVLRVDVCKRVPLAGEELEAFQRAEEARRAAEAEGGPQAMDAAGSNVEGGSPRAPRDAAAAQPTRANSSAIGHLERGAAGRAEVVAAGGEPLGERMDAEEEEDGAGACLLDGFEPPEGAAAPMFPAEDEWEAITFDEYGEIVDLGGEGGGEAAGGRLGRALASEAAAERGGGGDGASAGGGAGEDDAAAAPPEVPTKVERREKAVPLAARVARIDFDGRSDGRSVQTLLAQLAPRAAVVVRGSPEGAAALASHLHRELQGLQAAVFTPGEGEVVEVEAAASFGVELSDRLARAAAMHAVGGYELAWVDGVVGPPEGEDAPAEGADGAGPSGGGGGSGPRAPPTLLPNPAADAEDAGAAGGGGGGGEALHAGVFIGDVRLSELKRALGAAGIASDFHGGALHCAGRVVVRRHGEGGGGLVLEGAVTDEFYRVRDVVYAQYHVC